MAQEKRVNYFQGMMLVDQDFKDDQKYHRHMRHNHNSEMHTWGVVRGLEASGFDAGAVTVSEGLAIDANGKEIWWAGGRTQPKNPPGGDSYLVVESVEEERDDYPQMAGKHLRLIDRAEFSWKSAVAASDLVLALLSQGKLENNVRRTASSLRANRGDIEIRPVTTDGSLRLMTGAPLTERLTIDAGGKVGIGTTDPQARLHVRSNAGVLNLEGTDHAFIQWYPTGFGGGRKGWMGYESANEKNFRIFNETPGGNLILSSGGGRVGAGVTNPQHALDVQGNVGIRRGLLWFSDETGTPYPDNWIGMATNIEGGTKWLHIGGITDAGARRLVIAADKTFISGNVGIGTNAPEDSLQVGVSIRKFGVGEAYTSELDYGTSYAGFNATRARVAAGPRWSVSGDSVHNGGALIYGDVFGGLRFVTVESNAGGGQELTDAQIFQKVRMKINHQGVCIGNNNAGERLQVDDGDVLVRGKGNFNAAAKEARLLLGDANHYIKSVYNSGVRIGTTNAVDGITLLQGGNVGIGTDKPGSKLHIRRDAASGVGPTLHIQNAGGGSGAEARIDISTYDFLDKDPNFRMQVIDDANHGAHVNFLTKIPGPNANALASRLYIKSNGNVGIGTPSPNAALTISGKEGTYLNVKSYDGTYEVLLGSDTGGGIVSTMTNHDLQLRAGSNSTKMTIKADGKVGIGTKGIPVTKLEVNGAITTQQLHSNGQYLGITLGGPTYFDGIKGYPNLWLDAVNKVYIKSGYESKGMDLAEFFKTAEPIEPGEVVVFDEQEDAVRLCESEGDSRVIGIASTDPASIMGSGEGPAAIALCGRVPCNVDADIAPIRVGDLLTTSPTKGHAQKILDASKTAGAIIGKALGSLEKGKGTITVLVALA